MDEVADQLVSISHLVRQWLEWDKDPSSRVEIENLAIDRISDDRCRAQEATISLEHRLRHRIQFGTAGLRGPMMAGFSAMNCLTVIQTSQGIAEYLSRSARTEFHPISVVIGHDTRRNSAKFARLAANAFERKDIKVLLFEDYVPTPFVAFSVPYLASDAGIMITASHNPATDNGYKVYWSNGAQINTPTDQYIASAILDCLEPWPGAWDTSDIFDQQSQLLRNVREAYISTLKHHIRCDFRRLRPHPLIACIYTPIHGVGWSTMSEVALTANYCTLIPVGEQVFPDPDFPTVEFPNPEEEGALNLAYYHAEEVKLNLILANDPDADRFAVAQVINDKLHRFTGDQIGALLADYLIERELSKNDKTSKYAMLCSAASSGMLKRIIKAAGPRFHFEETLTGFKWIGNRAQRLEKNEGYTVLLGYEEALGYMFPSISYDKDGIAAASTFLCALDHWRSRGIVSAYSKLQSLYAKYGYHESINTYFTSESPTYTRTFFNKIRCRDTDASVDRIGQFRILRFRDVTNGVQEGDWQDTAPLPKDISSQMLTFHLDLVSEEQDLDKDVVVFTIRASGTEPKVKVYLECASKHEQQAQWLAARAFDTIVNSWILPYGAGLRHSGSMTSSSGQMINVEMCPDTDAEVE